MDALPVLFFGGSMILTALLFKSRLFLIGALACFWAGAAKVLWKIIVVRKKKNSCWLFLQMRIVMPIGFALMSNEKLMKKAGGKVREGMIAPYKKVLGKY